MSKRSAVRSVQKLCQSHKEGSYNTQADRVARLTKMVSDVRDAGFHHFSRVEDFKLKHVQTLVNAWKERGLADATMKNYMSDVRWLSEKIGKGSMVPNNDDLGIDRRVYLTNEDKSLQLQQHNLDDLPSERMRVSAELQRAFGLRHEEALKIRPSEADKQTHLKMRGSWCKGGVQRDIPITNEYQRELIEKAREIAGRGSMIPDDKSYKEHSKAYENATARAGIGNTHGLRHAYIHDRYRQLSGMEVPVRGGIPRAEMTDDERRLDLYARKTITKEIGHDRIEIIKNYIGRK